MKLCVPEHERMAGGKLEVAELPQHTGAEPSLAPRLSVPAFQGAAGTGRRLTSTEIHVF